MQTVADELKRRQPVNGEARRVFHGRGRAFPGYQDLLIDAYGKLLWVTLFAARDPQWLQQLVLLLRETFPLADTIVLQRRDQPHQPHQVLLGQLPDEPVVEEAGLRFLLRPQGGQNIGFFIDMAAGRALVRELARGKRVLNLFAYSCSFSVAALAGGAEQVVNVDMNKGALALGRRNHQLNNQDLRKVSFLPHEIFRSIAKLRRTGPYDLIICDPPYAQGKSFTAERHWPKLIDRLKGLLAENGEVVACLNAPHLDAGFLREHFAASLPDLSELRCLTAGEDFPQLDVSQGLSIQHFARRP